MTLLKFNLRFKNYIRNKLGKEKGDSFMLLEYIGNFNDDAEAIKLLKSFYDENEWDRNEYRTRFQ